tara:strand:+ start:100 stop:297 length:198 start_codon:yes stop_codon:yes gene_type:complete
MQDFTASIYIEGKYNHELYDLIAIETALEEWILDGYNPPDDSVLGLYDDDISINEVILSGGAVWQ